MAEQSVQIAKPFVPHPPEERGVLAPKDEIEPKKQIELQSKGYDTFLNGLCDEIDKELDERAEVRARRYTRNHNYWWGGERRWQYWTKEGFKSLESKKTKRLFSNNQFFDKVRTLLGTLTRSRSRIAITPAAAQGDNHEKTSGARLASRIIQHEQKLKLTASFVQREWTDRILYGFAARGQWYSKEGSTAKARIPKITQQDVQLPGIYVCHDCGATGPLGGGLDGGVYGSSEETEDTNCPHCGGQATTFPGETVQVPMQDGYEEIEDGDCITYGISPYEFDLAPEALDLCTSPYARWQRKVRKTKLKKCYPKLDLSQLGTTEVPIMLRAQDGLKKKREENTTAFSVFKTYWVDAEMYFEFASISPLTTLGGYEIPAGTVLSDLCPVQMRIDRADGKIVDIRPEIKEDCLSISVFHMDPQSWEGKGVDDAAELQRWIDDIHTLYVQIQLREALGITLYDNEFMSNGVFTGEVGTIKGVDVPTDGKKTIKDAMNIWSGTQPNMSIFNGLEYVQQSQTNVTGAFPSLSGSNMEGSETARGRMILREQALQGLGPQLYLAAEHDLTWAKQNLKYKQKYWVSERYLPYLEQGEPLGGRWFSSADINTEFLIDLEPDSWIPTTRLDNIDNMVTFMGGEAAMEAMGGFQGAPAPIRRRATELLNVPAGTDPEEKDLRNARYRYAVLKQAIEKSGESEQQVPAEANSPIIVPEEAAMQFATLPSVIPIPNVDNHAVFANFYRDAIKDAVDSDGIENHPLTKATLILLIKAHDNQGVFDAQQKMAEQVAVQAPMQAAQDAQQTSQDDASHKRDMEKSDVTHKQGLEKQAEGSKLKQQEIKAQGANKKSELSKVKI